MNSKPIFGGPPAPTTSPAQAQTPAPRPPAPRPASVPQQTDFASVAHKTSGQITSSEESITHSPAPAALVDPRHVHVSLSATKNLGNYESVKITIGATRPCINTDEAEEALTERMITTVTHRAQTQLANS